MNPFYYSLTDPRGPWIYVPAWPESAPKNAEFDNYSAVEWDRYEQAKAKALAAGIGVRPEDSEMVRKKAWANPAYSGYSGDPAQFKYEGLALWQPTTDTVYWLPLNVEIFEQYIEPPDTIHCNRGGDRKYVRILPNKEEPKSENPFRTSEPPLLQIDPTKIGTYKVPNAKPEEKKEAESGHRIHESVKNDPIAYFASIEDLLKYDHFYRNGLADRLNQGEPEAEEGV